jgi:transcriptional regulator with GAF, ATPase, and Fis domain
MDSQLVVRVLSEIAETASETLELQEVFNRVAASVRRLIPFEDMGVVRIVDGRYAVKHATTFDCSERETACSEPALLTEWSPRLRPRPESVRIDDAQEELDRAFRIDADILDCGVRSALWEPFKAQGVCSGGIWLSAPTPGAFTSDHQEILAPIAALLGSAVEHWSIWDAERRRRERLDRLESALASVSQSLDVHEVFERISEAVQQVLPHGLLVLSEIDEAERCVRVTATAGLCDIDAPEEPIALTLQEFEVGRLGGPDIVRDVQTDVKPNTDRNRVLISTGMRSWLRVPVLPSGNKRGSLSVADRDPGRYGADDVEVAERLADRIALMLSHQRLAEEARLVAEASERATRLEATVESLTRELESQGRTRVTGVSRQWKDVLQQVGRVAPSETTVLITGESGTGKEVVARLIHQGSSRARRPFVAVNCAALPEQLLESELFGYEKGAFTGAVATRVGRLEQAAGGTLFLDEIAEMSPVVQAKLLRVLQEREFQRLGGTRLLRADVRVLAATNRNLVQALERGQFREDLYYRLNVFEIAIPPLRDRTEDILPLADAFLEDLGRTMGRPAAGISRDAREFFLAHAWPGNVRELRNAIERAILLCDGGLITREHLPAVVARPEPSAADGDGSSLDLEAPLPAEGVNLAQGDRSFVERALAKTRGNRSKAARLLGLTRSQLYSRMERYKLN